MQTVSTYYGWTNRETWLANMWLNENKFSQMILLQAKLIDGGIRKQAAWLDKQLRMQLDDELAPACLWRDLLQSAYNKIDWEEVIASN